MTQAIDREQNLGRAVKWQDENEGWHTGKQINYPQLESWAGPYIHGRVEFQLGRDSLTKTYVLVKESCNGKLTWVEASKLQNWPNRSEWENLEPVVPVQALAIANAAEMIRNCSRSPMMPPEEYARMYAACNTGLDPKTNTPIGHFIEKPWPISYYITREEWAKKIQENEDAFTALFNSRLNKVQQRPTQCGD